MWLLWTHSRFFVCGTWDVKVLAWGLFIASFRLGDLIDCNGSPRVNVSDDLMKPEPVSRNQDLELYSLALLTILDDGKAGYCKDFPC